MRIQHSRTVVVHFANVREKTCLNVFRQIARLDVLLANKLLVVVQTLYNLFGYLELKKLNYCI